MRKKKPIRNSKKQTRIRKATRGKMRTDRKIALDYGPAIEIVPFEVFPVEDATEDDFPPEFGPEE